MVISVKILDTPTLDSLHRHFHSLPLKKMAALSLFLFHSFLPLPVMILGDFRTKSNMQWWIQLQVIFLFISIPIFLRFWWDWEGVRIGILVFRLPQSLKHKLSFDSSCMWMDLKATWRFSLVFLKTHIWELRIRRVLGCLLSKFLVN